METETTSTYQISENTSSNMQGPIMSDGQPTSAPPQSPKKNTLPKKWLLGGGIGVVIIALILVAINWYSGLPINQLKKALAHQNVSIAVQIYSTNSTDVDFVEKALKEFSDYVTGVENGYMEQSVVYETATADLNAIAEICDVSEQLQRIDDVETSRQTYEEAEAAFADRK